MHNQDPIYPLIERMFDLECEPQDWDGVSEIRMDMGTYGEEFFSNRETLNHHRNSVRAAIRELVWLQNAKQRMINEP